MVLTEKHCLSEHAATAWTRRGGCIWVGCILVGGIVFTGYAARRIRTGAAAAYLDEWLPLD